MRSNNQVNNPSVTGPKGNVDRQTIRSRHGAGNNRTTFLVTDYGDQRGILPISREVAKTVSDGDKMLSGIRTPV